MFVRAPTFPVGATVRIDTMLALRRSPCLFVCALALWLGLAGPPAVRAAAPPPAAVAVLAEDWSWAEFVKFWSRQAGKTSGVLGIVLLVGLGAALLILSKGSRP
jgi:hypothetical protein